MRDGGRASGHVVVLRWGLVVVKQRGWRRGWRSLLLLRRVRGRLGRGRGVRRRGRGRGRGGHRGGHAVVMVVAGRGLLTGLVVQYGYAYQALRRVRHVGRLYFCGHLPFPLVAPVLEPYFHLGLGQMQRRGQPGPLRAGQVPFDVERGLQLEHLAPRKYGPSLLLALAARPPATAAAATVILLVVIVWPVVTHVVVVVHCRPRRLVHVTAAASAAAAAAASTDCTAVAHEPGPLVVGGRPGTVTVAAGTVFARRPSVRAVAGQRRRAARVDAHAVRRARPTVLFVRRTGTACRGKKSK